MPRKQKREKSGADAVVRSVTIRMYFTGFGDCFLLTFHAEDGSPRYMLIDCGVHHQYPKKIERIRAVADDIVTTTKNKLDIVAITHEHTDHIYGFKYAEDIFGKMDIGELWFAWTEDPDDPLAQQLARLYGKKKKGLEAAIKKLHTFDKPHAVRLMQVAGFECGVVDSGEMKGDSNVLDDLRSWSKKPPQRSEDYLSPGNPPREIPGVKGVRCYVLGPPKTIESIRQLEDEEQMYFAGTPFDEELAFASAVLGAETKSDKQDLPGYPFDAEFSVPQKDLETVSGGFFKTMYGFSEKEGHGPKWRRIETAWLSQAADRLALSINNYTNNTSLVLAIELDTTPRKRVLLFTGDAQAGSWLTWKSVKWKDAGGMDDSSLTGEELMKRTDVIKVGHHGSRNATMRGAGLELMDSRNLVAMIPVDAKWAVEKKHWDHPDSRVLARLEERTRGRILRSDQIPKKGKTLDKPDDTPADEWMTFAGNVEWDKEKGLWIQYRVV
jgi:beta-lactamase superfamily II metal-dependent hydrolase